MTSLNKQFCAFWDELTANLMFDIRHRNAPRNIRDLFQDISNIHPYNTRTSASHRKRQIFIPTIHDHLRLESFMLKVLDLKYKTTLSLGWE